MKKIKMNSLEGMMDNSLTREQLKHVVGGTGAAPCAGKGPGSPCTWNGKSGRCGYWPFTGLICLC
ncbi:MULTISPECIES: hypothetical protein [unclassified Prevotella]|jgi:natural product precursor|uniref:hypothetical protein n=1 Tax=unclassified Prevotella TaxID=2638335 RepID=UPI0008CDB696|nr:MULTISPECIES: hypothetical protein [unclassified Prevotella]MCR5470929.1 hypothetical protein [Prevotella sp.]SEV97292.1 natural product precursor [Prevotella sp. khp7]